MILRDLQQDLEEIYRLDPFPSVEQFLISTQEVKKYIDEKEPRPQVLLKEENGEIWMAVHLGDETLQRLKQENFGNLSDFCSAVEEISHFLYLSFSAHNQRPITLLDVEVQGEIDKFVLASQYFEKDPNLFSRLFEQIYFDEQLNETLKARYAEANRLGGKFLKSLGEVFGEGIANPEALSRLRTFYRLNSQTRLSQISKL